MAGFSASFPFPKGFLDSAWTDTRNPFHRLPSPAYMCDLEQVTQFLSTLASFSDDGSLLFIIHSLCGLNELMCLALTKCQLLQSKHWSPVNSRANGLKK